MEELQSWEELVAALDRLPWTPAQQVAGATIYRTAEPLEDTYSGTEWYFEEPPAGIERYSLLGLHWDLSGAPISWSAWLEVLQVGQEAAYVLYSLEEDTPELVGKVVPPQSPAAYRALFLDFVRNGKSTLPLANRIHNGSPDLLDRATVRQGYWETAEQIDGWEELRAMLDRPKRGLAFTSTQASAQAAPVPVTDAASLSEAERQTLLDRYFEVCYEEAGDE